MRRRNPHVWLWAIMVCFCCCNAQQRTSGREVTVNDTLPEQSNTLPLPQVPSTLIAPEERAEYIIGHFWDEMDFTDTLRSHNRLFMEQNFVNFLSLFPHASPETLTRHISQLLKWASTDSIAFSLINDITEHYLDDPNSPMRNEEYYTLFLKELLRLPNLSEQERIRPAYRLKTAKKNRPGTIATDFFYTDRNGKRRTLHRTPGKRLLLLFYDPACSHCTEILDRIHESPRLARLVADKKLNILAVYTEGDRELWETTKSAMPREWTIAIDESHIVERELYSLPAMPVIYLLDRDKTVLLKDPSLELIEAYFPI